MPKKILLNSVACFSSFGDIQGHAGVKKKQLDIIGNVRYHRFKITEGDKV